MARPELRLLEDKDNYIRPWLRLGYKYESLNLSINPRFAFGKAGSSIGYWEDTQVIFHYDIPIKAKNNHPTGFWYLTEGSSDAGRKKSLYWLYSLTTNSRAGDLVLHMSRCSWNEYLQLLALIKLRE